MWTKALVAVLIIVGLALILMLALGIGGMTPGWLLIVYAPIVLIAMGALKFAVSLFRRRRNSN